MNRRARTVASFIALALVAAAIALPSTAFGGAHAASTHTVTLKALRFHPGTLEIHRGDSVKWVWADGEKHNVTSQGFHSATMRHGSYTVRFTRSGTFEYHCTIHVREGMKGKIIVH
jgi:plastocyanin